MARTTEEQLEESRNRKLAPHAPEHHEKKKSRLYFVLIMTAAMGVLGVAGFLGVKFRVVDLNMGDTETTSRPVVRSLFRDVETYGVHADQSGRQADLIWSQRSAAPEAAAAADADVR
ncbi:MAG: hypothetical protein H7831_11870 [Magnetococcus sp. WYHC-3]